MKKATLMLLGICTIIYCRIQAERILTDTKEETLTEISDINWKLVTDDVTATVYNACPEQCNKDYMHTASMYTLNMEDVLSDRVIAMERTMMAKYGLNYGDVVMIDGTGRWDGIWQIQDTMNKRFAGQHKIDILVPGHIRHGKWHNVKIYVPTNKEQFRNTLSQI